MGSNVVWIGRIRCTISVSNHDIKATSIPIEEMLPIMFVTHRLPFFWMSAMRVK